MGGIAEGAGVKNARYNAKTPGARPEGQVITFKKDYRFYHDNTHDNELLKG